MASIKYSPITKNIDGTDSYVAVVTLSGDSFYDNAIGLNVGNNLQADLVVTTGNSHQATLTFSGADLASSVAAGTVAIDLTDAPFALGVLPDGAATPLTVATEATPAAAPLIDSVTTDDTIDATEAASPVIVTGTTEDGSTVFVVVGESDAAEATVVGTTWSYELPADVIVDGTLSITATATDANGNPSDASEPKDVTVDLTPIIVVAAPVIEVVATDDKIDATEATSPVIVTGTTEEGSTVAVVVNGADPVDATVEGTTWTYELPTDVIVDGTLSITATATVDGHASVASETKEVTVDLATPVITEPTITYSEIVATEAAANDGSVSPITLTLTGDTFFSELAGHDLNSPADDLYLGDVVANVPAGLTAHLKVNDDLATAELTFEGNAVKNDAADNTEIQISLPSTYFELNNDTAPQGADQTVSLAFIDTPSLTTAGTFVESAKNDGAVTGAVTITLKAANFTADLLGTDLNTDGSYVENVPAGLTAELIVIDATTAELTLTGKADAANVADSINDLTYSFKATDFADGIVPTNAEVPQTASVKFITPSLSWSETSINDGEQNGFADQTATLTLTDGAKFVKDNLDLSKFVHDVPAGVTVTLIATSATEATLTVNGAADNFDTSTLTLNLPKLAFAGRVDVAGRDSATIELTAIDTVVPAAPTFDAIAGDDVITPAEKAAGVIITGTAEAGAAVTLTFADGTTTAEATNTDGVWSYELTDADYAAGVESITATAKDAAGNESDVAISQAVAITPEAPVITEITGGDVINATEQADGVVITGTTQEGSTVSVVVGEASAAEATVDGTTWTYTLPADVIVDGTLTVSATATNAAGTASDATTQNITVDTAAPEVPAFNDIASDNVISDTEKAESVTISGTGEAGSTVVLTFAVDTVVIPAEPAAAEISAITYSPIVVTDNGDGSFSNSVDVTVTDDAFVNATFILADGITEATLTVNPDDATLATLTFDGDFVDGVNVSLPIEALVSQVLPSDGSNDATLIAEAPVETMPIGIALASEPVVGYATSEAIVVDENGTWSYTLTDADYAADHAAMVISAVATDAAGNTSEAGTTTITQLDDTAPVITLEKVTGDDAISAIEKSGEVVVTGTTDDTNATIALTFGENAAVDAVVSGDTWSYTLTEADYAAAVYPDGATIGETTLALKVIATDVAGNESAPPAEAIIVVADTLAPEAPFIVEPTAKLVKGLVLTGTAEPEAKVTLVFGDDAENGLVRTVTADGEGNWTKTINSIELGALTDATEQSVTATAKDAAGNESAPVSFVFDTVAPEDPFIDLVTGDDSIDSTERDAGVAITGTAEVGAKVELTLTVDGVETTVEATNTDGAWSYPLTDANYPAEGFGNIDVSVTATDKAGNVSGVTTTTVAVEDTKPPVEPKFDVVATDGTIDQAEKAAGVTLTGTNEAGSTVALTFVDGTVAEAAVVGTTWSYTLTDTDYASFTGTETTITAIATDAANNTSIEATTTITLNIDKTPPNEAGAPVIIGGDNVINGADAALPIQVESSLLNTGYEAGDKAELFLGTTSLQSIVLDATNVVNDLVTFTIPVGGLGADGDKVLTVKLTDKALNTNAGSADLTLTLDTASAKPTFGVVTDDDKIVQAEVKTAVALTGTADANATVVLTFVDNTTATETATAAGTWSHTFTAADYKAGVSTITAIATDAVGNVSAAATKTIVTEFDTTAPLAATAAPTAATAPFVNVTEAAATVAIVSSLAGTQAVAGDSIALLVNGVAFATPVTKVLDAADITTGTVSFAVAGTALGLDGVKTLTSVVTDAAENVGAASPALSLTVDLTAPVAPTFVFDTVANSATTAKVSTTSAVTVAGLETGATWEYTLDGNAAAPVYTAGTGTGFTLAPDVYVAGDIKVHQIDAAGNIGLPASNAGQIDAQVAVSAAGSFDAAGAAVGFQVAEGDYTYNIANFSADDSIDFPAANAATVKNANPADGLVDLQYANNGHTVLVHLSGLTTTQDTALYSVNAFNTLFGANTVTNTGTGAVSTPTPTPTPTTPTTPAATSSVNVTGAGTTDVLVGNVTVNFAAGSYLHTVTNFAAGDVLDFPNDVTATVKNSVGSVGSVDVQWAANGQTVLVTLTGLTDAQDNAIYSLNSFNGVFGPGSIV